MHSRGILIFNPIKPGPNIYCVGWHNTRSFQWKSGKRTFDWHSAGQCDPILPESAHATSSWSRFRSALGQKNCLHRLHPKREEERSKSCTTQGGCPCFPPWRQKVAFGKRIIPAYRCDDLSRTRDQPLSKIAVQDSVKDFHCKTAVIFNRRPHSSPPTVLEIIYSFDQGQPNCVTV